MSNSFFVYILSNKNNMLYVGMTNDIHRRTHEHQLGQIEGYTKKFGISRLIYIEEFKYVYDAIEREKQIKGWRRSKKLNLIRETNPKFEDLSKSLFED